MPISSNVFGPLPGRLAKGAGVGAGVLPEGLPGGLPAADVGGGRLELTVGGLALAYSGLGDGVEGYAEAG